MKNNKMKTRHSVALVYVAFYGLIGVAVWLTGSAHCLWALLFTPSYNEEGE